MHPDRPMRMLPLLLLAFAVTAPLAGQSNTGELHVRVADPNGHGVKTTVQISSEANHYRNALETSEQGLVDVQRLPFGEYRVEVVQQGFAEFWATVEIRSSIPVEYPIRLKVATVESSVEVNSATTLISPDETGPVGRIGAEMIQSRVDSLPGRSLQDLVNSQPGWLYEGNAVLHPRGSEYQTQFVLDGIPLIDNRSPSFGPEIEADDVQSMNIYTAGFPAEYGRKMGGVVEVNTVRDPRPGFHGQVALSGGSFGTGGASAEGEYAWGKNALSASAAGAMTDHYLNPVVPQNYSNSGTTGDFAVRYERDLTPNDRLSFAVRHELSRYDIPNELVQQQAGQRQRADNLETIGIVSYQHIFSAHVLADVRGMVRDNANDFGSNADSTPLELFQYNRFREGYFKGTVTVLQGRHEWKAGIESDNLFLHENLSYTITDPAQFDPGTPPAFAFAGKRADLEQSAFVEDRIRAGNWTISAGLRWDHYQLLVNRQAFSPRLAVARYFAPAGLVAHFSYDRVFQTPSFENILLSNSAAIVSIDPGTFLRLPVEPSRGNDYEAGIAKAFFGKLRIDADYFRRDADNYADDDQIANTTISFPIAFRKSVIYGAEAKVELLAWRGLSGYASYSYSVGRAWLPVTGGLFLGAKATDAETQLSRHFPVSQDQRNTVRSRLRYQAAARFWIAGGIQYDSGLPFEFDGDPAMVLQEYGQLLLNRINFSRGRILPSLLVNASAGADLYKTEKLKVRLQVDGENLTNVLNVIDFGGLFSGNAIGPSRSIAVRLATNF